MGIQDRKERERRMRRRQIQDAAKEQFSQKGYRSTSVEDIAQQAELSPATIYLYFNNKEELYVSLMEMTLEILVAQLDGIKQDQTLEPEAKIRRLGAALLDTYLRDPLMVQIIFHVQLDDTLTTLSQDLLNRLNHVGRKGLAIMADIHREGVDKKVFFPADSMAQADTMWALFSGLVIWEEAKKKIDREKDYLCATVENAFETYVRGIKM